MEAPKNGPHTHRGLAASFLDRIHEQAFLIGFPSADKRWSPTLATQKSRSDFWAGRDRTRHVHLLSAKEQQRAVGARGGSFFSPIHLFLLHPSALEVGDSLLGVGPRIKAKGAKVQHKGKGMGPRTSWRSAG